MYVRVLQIKFPNELAKKSVMVLSRGIMQDFFNYGLLMRFNTEISTNTLMITALWKTKEYFEKAKENGKLRLEGKDYLVKDGDVLFFRVNPCPNSSHT